MFELFVAKRYIKSKHKLNFITIISIVSTLGITLGVGALIVVLSVFNGFGSLVTSILINVDPHVRINLISDAANEQVAKVTDILGTLEEIESYYPFTEGKAILLHDKTYEILNLKGVSEQFSDSDWGIKSNIRSGKLDLSGSGGTDKIIIGLPIAMRLSCRVGDTISITSASAIEKTAIFLSLPETQKYVVSGIFETSNKDFDFVYAFTSLESAKRTHSRGDRITGFEIRLHDIDDSEHVKEILSSRLDPELFSISTWFDLHKDLYSVMLIERWTAYIILCLIIAVATFNIFGSLTMTVIEKKKDIGILKTMGTKESSIKKIFMLEGLIIGIIGTVTGLLIGLFICYLQIEFNIYALDPSKYIIDSLPVELRLSDFAAVSIMSLFLSFFAALYPAKRAVKLSIIDAIKWE